MRRIVVNIIIEGEHPDGAISPYHPVAQAYLGARDQLQQSGDFSSMSIEEVAITGSKNVPAELRPYFTFSQLPALFITDYDTRLFLSKLEGEDVNRDKIAEEIRRIYFGAPVEETETPAVVKVMPPIEGTQSQVASDSRTSLFVVAGIVALYLVTN